MQTILCWFKRKIKTEISLSVSTYFCSYMIFLKCLFKSSIYSRAPFFIVVNYGFSECQKYEWRWKWTIEKNKKQYKHLFLKASAFSMQGPTFKCDWMGTMTTTTTTTYQLARACRSSRKKELQKIIWNFLQ
jgi:hypothetical protein